MGARLYFLLARSHASLFLSAQRFQEFVSNNVAFLEMNVWEPWSESGLMGVDLFVRSDDNLYVITAAFQSFVGRVNNTYKRLGFVRLTICFQVNPDKAEKFTLLDFVCSLSL